MSGNASAGDRVELTIDLLAEFYPREAVEQSAGAFAAVAEVSVQPGGPYHRVHVRAPAGTDLEALRAEFANYALIASARHLHGLPHPG
jgi:hypothetical protein